MIEQSLYALSVDLKNEFEVILESDGEVTELSEEKLRSLAILLENKTDSCVGYYESLTDQIDVVSKHIKVLTELKKTLENKQKRFEGYLDNCLSVLGKDEFKGSLSTIKRRKKPMVVNIIDSDLIPIEFLKTETVVSIDKAGMKKKLQAGEVISGAELVESDKVSLIIKKG